MPKVLRIFNRLIVGGPVLNVVYLTKYMSPEYDTLLVVGEKEAHEESAVFLTEQLAIDYTYLPEMGRNINFPNDYKAYKKLKQIIADFKPDIVHTHAAKPGALGRMAAAAMKVPVVVHTYHGHVFHSYFNAMKTQFYVNAERYLGKKTDAIIAISPAQKEELVDKYKIAPEEKFRVIPLGLDLGKFQIGVEEKRKKFRNEFSLDDDVLAIGIIGRLVPVKNHELFIEGIHHLLQNTSRKIKAFIIGDGEVRNNLEEKLKAMNIPFGTGSEPEAKVIFTSWRNDIDVINAGLDIIALTSLNEGTPVSLIEAQAANKPIVSTRVGGIQDIVIDGTTALLSDKEDRNGFAENLVRIVNDDDLRMGLSTNGRENVLAKFSYQQLVKNMSALYKELLEKK